MKKSLKGLIILYISALFIPLLAYGEKVVKEDALDSYSLLIWGLNYIYGNDSLGISMDKEKGIALVRRSAEQGQADAQAYIGSCYNEGGDCVSQDYAQAVYWLRKAAEQGQAEAQYNLGRVYYLGDGVSVDKRQAVYWWRKAAEQGQADAIELLKKVCLE